jgi:hypothetical protein
MTKTILLSAVLTAGSAIAREPTGHMVTICLTTDRNPAWLQQSVIERATTIADQILASAGVHLTWRGNLDPCLGESVKAVQVDLSWNTPPGESPGALGYAQPFGEAYVRVFCDRIQQSVPPEREPYKLGHVLAHEITHVLEGTNFHAVSGVMKAVWDFGECRRMAVHPLMFTATDILLIRQGIENRVGFRPARQHAPPVLIAPVK